MATKRQPHHVNEPRPGISVVILTLNEEINVEVVKFDGTKIQGVKTYKVKTEKETPGYQAPKKYYLNLIIRNAEKYGFPDEYTEFLNSLETID